LTTIPSKIKNSILDTTASSSISRRTALRGLLGGVAMGVVPDVAEAVIEDPADADVINACVEKLREVLGRMHPIVDEVHYYFQTESDGTFRLNLEGTRQFEPFSGDGLYELSWNGYLMTFWLEKVTEQHGRYLCEHYWATQYYDGQLLDDGKTSRHCSRPTPTR
jgi:hypothetical protein